MKKTKYHVRALGIIIAISILLSILYEAVSYGQIYTHTGGASIAVNHTNYSKSSDLGVLKAKANSSTRGGNVQFLNHTAIDKTNTTPTGSRNVANYGNNNSQLQPKPNSTTPNMPKPMLLNRTIFLRNATVTSQSTYMKGSNYLMLKTVSITYSNYTFNISRVSYVRLKAEASQKDSGIIILEELPLSNTLANESQQLLEINGTSAIISGIYSPGRLRLSIGNMNITNRIAVQIGLNITPVT